MTFANIKISDYDYPLPDERIAKHPLAMRDRCKLLALAPDGKLTEGVFAQLPELLPAGARVVFNNTRVINARVRFNKESGANIEIFCLEPVDPVDYALNFASAGHCRWLCLVGNSKRWKEGTLTKPIAVDGQEGVLRALRIEKRGNASIVEFSWEPAHLTFAEVISAAGVIPIPPYLNRDTEAEDSQDYQTVYSKHNGSVAAPTAGLHFTPELLQALDNAGMERRELTLHVGAGTFQPVKDDDVTQHQMHSEFISVPLALIEDLARGDKPVVAVGTTSVRTLESLYQIGCLISQARWDGEVPQWYPYAEDHPRLSRREALETVAQYMRQSGLGTLHGSTRIIIAPGYDYKVVDAMVTNFHQPRSTLLLLVAAFIGEGWREAYQYALDHDFRFLSYGDACLFFPQN
ncbi:MAG: S-adenosylmethionine:tRNA ribosyltransferase-isomerase [Bacteroidales bacterium]|nr:S-adenosylmethionine:tRNA ribosyltransferase-isomerase [Bacteroidales bacterium]